MPTLTAGSATDVGLVRASNQDALLIDDALFAVADGMGGAGEAASTLALNTLQATFARKGGPDGLLDACRAANSAVWHEAQSGAPDLPDMGSTITAIGVVTRAGDEGLAAVNVGDSRAYLLHLGQLRRLTVDHSHVQDLVLAGDITEQVARLHPSEACSPGRSASGQTCYLTSSTFRTSQGIACCYAPTGCSPRSMSTRSVPR